MTGGRVAGLKGRKANKFEYTYIVRLRMAILPAQIGVVGVSCAIAVFNPGQS